VTFGNWRGHGTRCAPHAHRNTRSVPFYGIGAGIFSIDCRVFSPRSPAECVEHYCRRRLLVGRSGHAIWSVVPGIPQSRPCNGAGLRQYTARNDIVPSPSSAPMTRAEHSHETFRPSCARPSRPAHAASLLAKTNHAGGCVLILVFTVPRCLAEPCAANSRIRHPPK